MAGREGRLALSARHRLLWGADQFSTFQVETIRLARDSGLALAAAYALASIAAGMALAYGVTRLVR